MINSTGYLVFLKWGNLIVINALFGIPSPVYNSFRCFPRTEGANADTQHDRSQEGSSLPLPLMMRQNASLSSSFSSSVYAVVQTDDLKIFLWHWGSVIRKSLAGVGRTPSYQKDYLVRNTRQ